MGSVSIIIDFEIPEGLSDIYAEMSDCSFVGNKEGTLSKEQAQEKLEGYKATKLYGGKQRLGIMKIYFEGQLAGLAFPRAIEEKEHKVMKIDNDLQYHRIGTVYISKHYRRRGIMRQVIKQFQELYPNLIWTCNILNVSSAGVALSAGLKHSHDIFVKKDRQWEFVPNDEQIRVDRVFKSEVM